MIFNFFFFFQQDEERFFIASFWCLINFVFNYKSISYIFANYG